MSQPQFTRRTCRPRDAVDQASRDYPGAWGVLDQFRADKGHAGRAAGGGDGRAMSADRLPAYTPDRARELRAAAGHSLDAMAQAVGYTAAQNWAALEQGQRRPAPSVWILALIVSGRHPVYGRR